MDTKKFYGKSARQTAVIARQIPVESDDSELESDNGDEDYVQPTGPRDSPADSESDTNNNDETQLTEDIDDNVPSTSWAGNSKHSAGKEKKSTNRTLWIPGNIDNTSSSDEFTGDSDLSGDLLNLKTPLQFYHKLFPELIEEHIVEHTNLFSVQSRPQKPLNMDRSELQQFIGISIWMSLVKLPDTRKYWNPTYKVERVSEVMSCNRWEEIKRFIHFENNMSSDEVKKNKLWKIRPVLTNLREVLLTIPKEKNLCVDEQIVPFKGRSSLKKYNPRKPHRWGYKLHVLSGVSGFSYDFEVCSGNENVVADDEVDCGASSNIVLRLSRTIESGVHHHLYFDNYFTSMSLMSALERRAIHGVGTVRLNRLPGLPGLSEKEMKKKGRGTMSEYVTNVAGVEMSCVRWYDNKIVSMLSTFAGVEPVDKVKRWSTRDKKYIEIDRPHVIKVYNEHMGGVDLLDSLLGLYRIRIRSKKWYHRMFFHILDLSIVNAWLLYRRVLRQNLSTEVVLPLSDFKAQVAEGIICFNL